MHTKWKVYQLHKKNSLWRVICLRVVADSSRAVTNRIINEHCPQVYLVHKSSTAKFCVESMPKNLTEALLVMIIAMPAGIINTTNIKHGVQCIKDLLWSSINQWVQLQDTTKSIALIYIMRTELEGNEQMQYCTMYTKTIQQRAKQSNKLSIHRSVEFMSQVARWREIKSGFTKFLRFQFRTCIAAVWNLSKCKGMTDVLGREHPYPLFSVLDSNINSFFFWTCRFHIWGLLTAPATR